MQTILPTALSHWCRSLILSSTRLSTLRDMNIAEILHKQVEECPDTPAILDLTRGKTRTVSFAELELAARRTQTLLRQKGIQPGDSLLLFQPMSVELYVALIAIFRLGAIATFLDPSAGKAHLARCCTLRPPKALIASFKAHFLRLRAWQLQQIPLKFAIGFPFPGATSWNRAKKLEPDPQIEPCTPETPALITFTSGSTGEPKAAQRTHGFLIAQYRALSNAIALTPGETDLTTLPIFLLANLAAGVTSVIPNADLKYPGAIAPKPILSQIKTHQPTRTAASPALLARLAQECIKRKQTLTNFQKIYSGGAPVFPPLLDRLHQIAPQAEIIGVYGSTEAEPIAHISRSEIHSKDLQTMQQGGGLLVGKPVEEIELKIIKNRWGEAIGPYNREEFSQLCNGVGEPGEIVVSGEHVLPGYLYGVGDEETKFKVEEQPWHRTGDAGYLDEEGRLWLLGRCKACITDKYGTLYPFAVECAANFNSDVQCIAFLYYNYQRTLVIEMAPKKRRKSGVSVDRSLASLLDSLKWANIETIRVVEKIPLDKRHNAKIDYPALEKVLAEAE